MQIWRYIYGILILILFCLVIALLQLPDTNLHIIACDVGEGDAILVVYKNIQILTDGGPDQKVINCLGRHLPFWDRQIELVVSTHPDADHSTGLTDVIKKYNVGSILVNPIDPGTQVYKALENAVGSRRVRVVNPLSGMSLGLDLIQLDILSPQEEMYASLINKNSEDKMAKYEIGKETNLYSIIYKLSFKNFSGLFTGDAPPDVTDKLLGRTSSLPVNYIKVPHHGSTNGLTENLLTSTMPKVAVISVGVKNMWGFPAPEILTMLNKYGIKILRTDLMGDVEVTTDGEKYWVEK